MRIVAFAEPRDDAGAILELAVLAHLLLGVDPADRHPEADDAAQLRLDEIIGRIADLPGFLARTLVQPGQPGDDVEQTVGILEELGPLLARHGEISTALDLPIYFCDPASPWQRGSNENTNGLLRQYLPKGTDLSVVSREELDAIQDSLNGRPRKTLGYLTPSEKLAEFLALTA